MQQDRVLDRALYTNASLLRSKASLLRQLRLLLFLDLLVNLRTLGRLIAMGSGLERKTNQRGSLFVTLPELNILAM